ncbi:MAG: hypothetical protein ACYTEZ_16325 [Planctomycetota bacterium]|jgi:hypothetical protein
MRWYGVLFALAAAVHAQETDPRVAAGEALTLEECLRIRDRVLPRIEAFTRMRFRRPVPIVIEPQGVWEAKRKADADSWAGHTARHAAAFYTPGINRVTVVPWVIGGYAQEKPPRKTRRVWIAELEPTLIHELTHAIHHQNFFSEGRLYAASLKVKGLTEEELDRATVDFLLGEGFPEIVSLRTTEYPERMGRHPSPELNPPGYFKRTYVPNGKEPYRIILFNHGYRDGLNLLHHLYLKAGPRAVRAVLYRPPPRILLFQPEILGAVNLDDPPEPDSILGFLSPAILAGGEIRLAVNPGHARFFKGATRRGVRAHGCLLGYVAEVGEESGPDGRGRYAFFVADPDRPGQWSAAQARSLKALRPDRAKEKKVPLPLAKGLKARLLTVAMEDKSLYVRADLEGLVVLAHESQPTRNLAKRVLRALRVLYIKRPKARLYDEAHARARQRLPG